MSEPIPSRTALIFAVLSLAAVILLAGLYLWDRQNVRREQNNAMIDQLQRIDARLTKIETIVTAQSDANSTMTQSAATITAQSAELRGMIEHLQQNMASANQIQQTSALMQLKSAVNSGHAFGAELAQIQGADTSALALMASGVATPEQLAQELSALAPDLMHGEVKKDWWHQILGRLSGFIIPRPLPSASADITTPDGKISRALYDLEQHDVQGALDVLPKPAPAKAGDDARLADFYNHAENYLTAQKDLLNLQSALMAPPPAAPINSPTMTLMPPAGASK